MLSMTYGFIVLMESCQDPLSEKRIHPNIILVLWFDHDIRLQRVELIEITSITTANYRYMLLWT